MIVTGEIFLHQLKMKPLYLSLRPMFCILGFSDFYLLQWLSSFLGAGSSQLTRRPLGGHQERLDRRSEREHGSFYFRPIYKPIYAFPVESSEERRLQLPLLGDLDNPFSRTPYCSVPQPQFPKNFSRD